MTLLPDGTGLTTRASDIVGRTDLRFGDIVKFTHRFRLDHNDFVLRRNEFDATIGGHKSYFEVGYLRLNRDIASTFEDCATGRSCASPGAWPSRNTGRCSDRAWST
jgi:LPS-assembly protein